MGGMKTGIVMQRNPMLEYGISTDDSQTERIGVKVLLVYMTFLPGNNRYIECYESWKKNNTNIDIGFVTNSRINDKFRTYEDESNSEWINYYDNSKDKKYDVCEIYDRGYQSYEYYNNCLKLLDLLADIKLRTNKSLLYGAIADLLRLVALFTLYASASIEGYTHVVIVESDLLCKSDILEICMTTKELTYLTDDAACIICPKVELLKCHNILYYL